MQTYVRVRNVCAHHGRLWNVGLGVYPAFPNSSTLQSVLDSVSPRSSWARRLHELLNTRTHMNLAGMGVPEDWADNPFWSRRIS